MTIKKICSWSILMKLASELGKARQSGDTIRIKIAEKNHTEYKNLCLECDELSLEVPLSLL